METSYYQDYIDAKMSSHDTVHQYFALLKSIHLSLCVRGDLMHGFKSKFTSIGLIDTKLYQFSGIWDKFSMLGIPEDRYMNIIEKILEYTQMIIDQKGVDYQTLPGMKEFVELVDQQFEEIVSKDPKLDALRKDPYGL